MTLPLIVYRSLRQHALTTLVTATSLALAAGLLMTVWAVKSQSQRAFTETSTGFDAVLAARGSKLQIVLNAIFHLEASPGNLPYSEYERVRHDPRIKAAVPLAVGDNFFGWRIVGTTPELFTTVEYAPGRTHHFAEGVGFDPTTKQAVVGSFVAQKLKWKVGDTFKPYHGLAFNPADQHDDLYTVVGILAPTNTPADRVIWIPLKGLQTMAGHDPKAANDISAVLIQLRSPAVGFMMDMMYNKQGDKYTLAWPVNAIITDLFSKISWFDQVLALVAYLVALVAAGSVLASIYASMSARRRDIAILRALGARRRTIFGAVVAEAGAIGALGSLGGYLIYFGLLITVAGVIRTQTGVVLQVTTYHPILWICPCAMIVLGSLGGVVPAFKAYQTPVAETLAPVS